MIAGHYLVPVLLGRDLHRLAAYTWGVAGIVIPFGAWLFLDGATDGPALILAALLIVVGGAGAGTVVCHGADKLFAIRAELQRGRRGQS